MGAKILKVRNAGRILNQWRQQIWFERIEMHPAWSALCCNRTINMNTVLGVACQSRVRLCHQHQHPANEDMPQV